MKVVFIGLSIILSSCALLVDTSDEARHLSWVKSLTATVGKSMFNCAGDGWCYQFRDIDGRFQSDKKLDNGNREADYYWFPSKKCHYFFEYEPESGLIVGFRYEESEQFACRFTGA